MASSKINESPFVTSKRQRFTKPVAEGKRKKLFEQKKFFKRIKSNVELESSNPSEDESDLLDSSIAQFLNTSDSIKEDSHLNPSTTHLNSSNEKDSDIEEFRGADSDGEIICNDSIESEEEKTGENIDCITEIRIQAFYISANLECFVTPEKQRIYNSHNSFHRPKKSIKPKNDSPTHQKKRTSLFPSDGECLSCSPAPKTSTPIPGNNNQMIFSDLSSVPKEDAIQIPSISNILNSGREPEDDCQQCTIETAKFRGRHPSTIEIVRRHVRFLRSNK